MLSTFIKEHGRNEVYSEEELSQIEKGKATIASIIQSPNLVQAVDTGDPLVIGKTAHLTGDRLLTGFGECIVDGELEELVAYEYLKTCRESSRNFRAKGGVKRIVKERDSHSFYCLSRVDIKVLGFKHREWRSLVVWKKEGENKIIVCYDDTDALDEEYPRDPNVVVGSSHAIWEYERLPVVEGVPQTRVKQFARIDIAGSIPTFVMNRISKNYGRSMIGMRKKFDKSLEIDAGRRAAIVQSIKQKKGTEGAEALRQLEALLEERPGWIRPSRSYGKADSKLFATVAGDQVRDS